MRGQVDDVRFMKHVVSRRGMNHVLYICMHNTIGKVEGMVGRFNISKKDTKMHGKKSCEEILSQVMDSGKMVMMSQSLSISSGIPSTGTMHTWVCIAGHSCWV